MEEESIPLGRQIGHVSHLFHRNIDNVIVAESRDGDGILTGRNFWVLRYLLEHPNEDVFQRDLEAAFKVRRSTVSRMVELMEQKDLIRRESVNGDARLKRLSLTTRSKDVLKAVSNGVDRMNREVRAEFTAEEYDTLTTLLAKLSAVLESRETNTTQERNTNDPL